MSYVQGTPSYVELQTPDQQAARAFYGSLFGWEIGEVPLDDQGNVYLTPAKGGESVAGIAGQMPEMAGHPAFWGVYLAVDDVDATAAKVEGAGGKVEAGPFDVMDLGRMAAIQDPTGARVNLWQAGTTIGTTSPTSPAPRLERAHHPRPRRPRRSSTPTCSVWAGRRWRCPGGEYTSLVVDGRPGRRRDAAAGEGIPPHWNVYFNVEDVDASWRRPRTSAPRSWPRRSTCPGVGRMGFLADPQGATFAVMAGADPGGLTARGQAR